MKARTPLTKVKSRMTNEKSSGKTPDKPRGVARLSRKDKDIPADRGAHEQQSTTQGSD